MPTDESGNREGDQQQQQGTQQQGQPPGQTQQGTGAQENGVTPTTWDEVLEGLPETARTLYEGHTQGLRSALDAERDQRRELAKQLRDATGQLEEGSKAREALEAATGQLEEATKRADFFQEAARPEIGCANPELAYLAATKRELFDRRGNPNWGAIKESFPELFKKPTPPAGNAGAGTGQTPPKEFNMNTAIRQAASKNQL